MRSAKLGGRDVGVWVQGAQGRLGERCPDWLGGFAGWLLERSAPAVSLRHFRRLERDVHTRIERPGVGGPRSSVHLL